LAQFDVHRSTGRARAGYPYLVVVQSAKFDRTATTRLVIPLTPASPNYPAITPVFTIEERHVVLDPLLMFPIPVDRLGAFVTSLADDESASRIIAAIDQAITTAYG